MSDLQNIEHTGLSIKDQVIADIERFALEKQISVREVIKDIANTSGIALRNLERIVGKGNSTPSNETLIKIYSYFYSTNTLVDLIIKAPEVIANSIKMDFLITENSQNNKMSTHSNIEILNLTKSDIFNSIYLMTSGEFGTDLIAIREEFGKLGLQTLDEMIKRGIVKVNDNDKLSREKCVFLTAEMRRNMVVTVAKQIYKPKKNDVIGANYSGVFMGEVTHEDYDISYAELKSCLDNIGKRICNSKPTQENFKRIALVGILEEIEKNGDGGMLC
jgi:hypothetical protein